MKDTGMGQKEAFLGTPVTYPGVQQPPVVPPYQTAPGYATQPPAPVTYTYTTEGVPQHDDRSCRCSAGWVLFVMGFFLPFLWIVGLFLPCCTENRNDYRAQKACGIALIVSVAVGILLGALDGSDNLSWGGHGHDDDD